MANQCDTVDTVQKITISLQGGAPLRERVQLVRSVHFNFTRVYGGYIELVFMGFINQRSHHCGGTTLYPPPNLGMV